MIADYFNLAVKNLLKRKLRSWLTMAGIFISIATVFILISLSLGLQGAVKEQFSQLGTDKFFIFPNIMMMTGPGSTATSSGGFTIADADVVEKVSGVKRLTYFAIANAEIEYKDVKKYIQVASIPGDDGAMFESVDQYKPEEGTFDLKNSAGKIVLGNAFKTGKVFGKEVKVGDKITLNGNEFKVQGILKSFGNPSDDKMAYIEFKDFQYVFKSGDRIDEIFVQVESTADIVEVAKKAEKALLKHRDLKKENKDFNIQTPEELLASFSTILNIITGFLLGIAAISLLVGGIGIANTMYASTIERTKEIGTMKAVGAKNSDILSIFLIESGLLGLSGGIVGVLIGTIISKTIEFIANTKLGVGMLQAATPWYLFIGCLAFAFIAGAVSGIWPAYKASKLNTVDALRYE
ncbi:MAG: ABC transporter permease [Nanoarchaeota archaeon]